MTGLSLDGRILLIAGPTASGKSERALAVAEREGAMIVNADALQVYRDLEILSARPGPQGLARAPHALYGHVDGAETYSVGRWLDAALAAIRDATQPLVFVGGTGLYFKALTEGLAHIPTPSDDVIAEARARLEAIGGEAFLAEIAGFDPKAAESLRPSDPSRLIRAWSVFQASGTPITDWRADTKPPLPTDAWRGVVIEPEREALYARCEARFDAMMEAGGLDEARRLKARDLDTDLPVMKAVGVRPLLDFLDDLISWEEAVDLAKRDTRRFAKRQLTWFRHQAKTWERAA